MIMKDLPIKTLLMAFFAFLLAAPMVHADAGRNFTLYPSANVTTAPFTNARFAFDVLLGAANNTASRREISPGEFDSTLPGNTDAGQWRPNQTIGNTTAAVEISSLGSGGYNAQSLSAGWLWNSTDLRGYNLTNETQRNGNWTFLFTARSGQGTSGSERIAARITIVRDDAGTLGFVKGLLSTRITGEGSHVAGQEGWRDSDFRITHPNGLASDRRFAVEMGPTNESYVFKQGDVIYFEFGFYDADGTGDRTLTLVYNFSNTNVTTPWFEPVNLTSNASFTTFPTTITTAQSTTYTGNCTVNGGTAEELDIRIQDNRTGSFSNSTTNTGADVYVNVTNYTVANLQGNTSSFTFEVRGNTAGNYSFRTQCESATTINRQFNTSLTSDIQSSLIVEVVTDTCTPPGGTDWTIEASDNCFLDTQTINVGRILIKGNTGTVTFKNSNIISTDCRIEPSAGQGITLAILPTTTWRNAC